MNADSNTQAVTQTASEQLFERARKVLPGGISRNTVFRLPHPIYAAHGTGCRVTDIEGVERIDFSNNVASLIHGHAHPAIVAAVTEQLQKGSAFAVATEAEVAYAEFLCNRVPGFEKIRFINSGTEAVMTAIKAARAFTDKPKIAKVEGAYHGAYDYVEVSQYPKPENWGDAASPTSVPLVKGTPRGTLDDVVILPFNDPQRAVEILDKQAGQIACVVVDPLPHRVGFIWAADEFVQALFDWTRRNDALLVFDEVITFRTYYAGAQQRYPITPDLTALGKMIGGGFPVGAVAGRDDVMSVMDPTQTDLRYPHAGTFSANPISLVAGHTAMQLFDKAAVDELNALGDYARQKISEAIGAADFAACVTGDGSLLRIHLKPDPPTCFRTCYTPPEESKKLAALLTFLLNHGVSMVNTCSAVLSTVMTKAEIDHLADVVRAGLQELSSSANSVS